MLYLLQAMTPTPTQSGVSALEVLRTILAVGPLLVAILAIWGDWVRACLAGPRLTLSLRQDGYLTPRNGGNAIFYHVEVSNQRIWSPAKAVRVMVVGIEKRRPDGSYFLEPFLPLQLTWIIPELHEQFPTVTTPDICDLGYLDQHAFTLSVYRIPLQFPGSISGNEGIRVTLVARAQNGESRPLVIEISWDGTWVADIHQVQKHMVVKEVHRESK
jgi:hypothetical protein